MQQNVNEIELESGERTECVLIDPENPPERGGIESEGGVSDIVVKEEAIEEVNRSNLSAPLKCVLTEFTNNAINLLFVFISAGSKYIRGKKTSQIIATKGKFIPSLRE